MKKPIKQHGWLLLLLLVSLIMGACNHEAQDDEMGEAFISLTDAPDDFLDYTVDVTSISLEKASGAMVETLPTSTSVDFSQYVEMTELVTAASITSGRYVKATMHLDYSNANIVVEDNDGNPVNISDIKDSDGNPITQFSVSVNLTDRNALVIAPGIPAHLSLDFDLKASNDIEHDADGLPVAIVVDPTVTASLEVDKDKENRLRGALHSVDEAAQTFSLIVRPFRHIVADNRQFGRMDVSINEETQFEIDGQTYVGQAGLEQLALEDKNSSVIVFGQLKPRQRTLLATQVLGGDSVASNSKDVIHGHVIARDGNTLTIKGARLTRANGKVQFGNTMDVSIGDSTRVTKKSDAVDLAIDAISVGQRVTVLGNVDASTAQFDATEGLVRLMLTNVRGNILSVEPGEVVMQAQRIDHRRSTLFDFTGTGVSSEDDADAENYEVNTSSLNVDAFTNGDPIIARGHVSPFGSAPADFDAQTLIGLKEVGANLVVDWRNNGDNTLLVNEDASLSVFVNEENRFHHIVRRGIRLNLTQDGAELSVLPSEQGVWVIQLPAERVLHTDYAAFVNDLELHLNDASLQPVGIKAHGHYDDESRQMTATRIVTKFK